MFGRKHAMKPEEGQAQAARNFASEVMSEEEREHWRGLLREDSDSGSESSGRSRVYLAAMEEVWGQS